MQERNGSEQVGAGSTRFHGETPVPLGWADCPDDPGLARDCSDNVVVPPKEWGIEGPDVATSDVQSVPLSDG
jgi:hypothetical protein